MGGEPWITRLIAAGVFDREGNLASDHAQRSGSKLLQRQLQNGPSGADYVEFSKQVLSMSCSVASASGPDRRRRALAYWPFKYILAPRVVKAAVLAIALSTATEVAAQSVGQTGPAGEPPKQESITAAPKIHNARYTESYSYLRTPSNWIGAWWEPFKYIPLDTSGTSYMTLGLELRFRLEDYRNFDWGEVPVDSYQWYRALPYVDLHLGPNVRLFAQMIGAWATGKETPLTGVDTTGFELLQGFAEFRVSLDDTAELTLRGGRQVLSYGSERLISMRWGPNVLRSFDAGLASVQVDRWRIDSFYARPVRNRIMSFNDSFDADRSLWSLYATGILGEISPASGLDIYYIGYQNTDATFEQGSGNEVRHTLGSRFFGVAQQGWDWNFEAMFQFGRFADGNISAWSVASDTGYTFRNLTLSPRVGLKAGIISGDLNPSDAKLETFNPLFPNGKYFGEIGMIGPYNLINLHPTLTLRLNEHWALQGTAVFYWRESLGDGLYDNAGNLVRPSGNSKARYIGTQADVVLSWEPVRWFSAQLAYSVFAAGAFIMETGPSKTTHFVGFETVVRF